MSTPQTVRTATLVFRHLPPGKPSPKSMLQDLPPESRGKKIEPSLFFIKVPILSAYYIIYDLLSVFPMAYIAMSQVTIIEEQR